MDGLRRSVTALVFIAIVSCAPDPATEIDAEPAPTEKVQAAYAVPSPSDPANLAGLPAAGSEVILADAHVYGEETVRRCMAEHGFDYDVRPFVEPLWLVGPEPDAALLGASLRENGYTGVYTGLTMSLLPTGAPPAGMSRSELDEYTRVLVGDPDAHPHETDGSVHEHGPSTHSHQPDLRFDGCQGAGEIYSRSLVVLEAEDAGPLDDPHRLNEFVSRVHATVGYEQFEDAWAECITTSGYSIDPTAGITGFPGPAMAAHSMSQQMHFMRETSTRMNKLLSGTVSTWDHTLDELSTTSATISWFQEVINTDSGLQELFDEELELAIVDADCRIAHQELLQEAVTSTWTAIGLDQ